MYGENESGKSTLQQFILFMFFGLSPKQRKFFRSKTGGKMGGRLTVIDHDSGEYTIERLDEIENGAARCFHVDGQEYGEDWLQERLKGMTKEIYQSVYSFSALDLIDFKQMKDEDIGEVLLGIGLTGSNNIYQIEKQLDQKIAALFKRTGKIPVINRQLESLEERFQQLTNDKENEATYQGKQEQLDLIHDEIDHLQIKLREIKEKKQTIERYLSYLPIMNDYHLYVGQLKHYPHEITFPEDGVERLSQWKERLLPLQSELSILKTRQEKLETERANMQDQQLEEQFITEAQQLLLLKNDYDERRREKESINEKMMKLHMKIEADLQKLHVGCTLEQLENISLPFFLEEKWNGLKNENNRLDIEHEQLHQEQSTVEKQRAFLMDQVREVKAKLLSTERLGELYAQIDAYKEADYRHKLQTEANEKRLQWEKGKKRKEQQMNSLLIGSLIIGVLFSGAAILFDQSLLYNFMMLTVLLGVGQWILSKKGIKETTDLLSNDGKTEEQGHSISITLEEKQIAEQLLMEDDENKSMLKSFTDQLKSIDVHDIQLAERIHGLDKRRENLYSEIEEQHEHYPFLIHIDINYWQDFYHTMKQLLVLTDEKQTYKLQLKDITEKIDKYTAVITNFIEKLDRPSTNQSLHFQLELMENMVITDEQFAQSIEGIAADIAENTWQQEKIGHQMDVYEQEIQELLNVAGVGTEDEFYKNDKLKQEKGEIEEKIQKMGEQLQIAFSPATWKDISKQKPSQSKLEVENEQIDEDVQTIEENIHVKRQQLADIHADLARMESSDEYSQTMHQYMLEKDALAQSAKEWAVLKTAKEMLAETKRKYRDKHLTDVIARTSVYFSKVTDRAYVNIIPPQAGKPFQVETAGQMRYEVSELSQGTIDQLYVCLRLAISEMMSKEHHLPFIIDDAFVHFDALRTKQMVDILMEISQKQQIILFTCKKDMTHVIPESHIVRLRIG